MLKCKEAGMDRGENRVGWNKQSSLSIIFAGVAEFVIFRPTTIERPAITHP